MSRGRPGRALLGPETLVCRATRTRGEAPAIERSVREARVDLHQISAVRHQNNATIASGY